MPSYSNILTNSINPTSKRFIFRFVSKYLT
nr:MAG TPA: hypothetical protein [Caudoviricetes sp.]